MSFPLLSLSLYLGKVGEEGEGGCLQGTMLRRREDEEEEEQRGQVQLVKTIFFVVLIFGHSFSTNTNCVTCC